MVVETSAAAAVIALDSAARQLRKMGDGFVDAVAEVHGLVDLVHWQAASALVFHERAEAWAQGVRVVESVLDAARANAMRGKDRAAFDADLDRLRG